MVNSYIPFIFVVCAATCYGSWVNQYDGPFQFKCPDNQAIIGIKSQHDNFYEDRQFEFRCQTYTSASGTETCKWTEYQNVFDAPMTFQCPNQGVITGVASYHDNNAEDRRFRFHCCEKTGVTVYNCENSGFVNKYDQPSNYNVPVCHALRGWISVHDNAAEDRIMEYEVCKITPCEL